MTVQEHFASITNLFNDITSAKKDESTKYYKNRCERANKYLQDIKQKFEENEKHIESIKGKAESTSETREMVDVKKDLKTTTFTMDAVQNDKGGEQNSVAGKETHAPIQEDSKIIAETRDTEQGKKDKTNVANIKQHDEKDNSTKSASRHQPDLAIEKQLKADYDELKKKLNSVIANNARLEKQLQEEKNENSLRKQRIDELTNRLSAFAAHQLTKFNPQIADLGDQCRPTKLAEGFSQLYDNQWTDAFGIFDKKKEREIIDMLSDTIKLADEFCKRIKTEMTESILLCVADEINNPKISGAKDLPKSRKLTELTETKLAAERHIKDLMKALAMKSSQPIAQMFLDGPMKEVVKKYRIKDKLDQLDKYAVEAAKLVWMMKVQQPPVEFLWAKPESRFTKETFTFYTKKGDIVDQCIWPAVLLHKDGPVMARGVAQGK